MNRQGLFPSLQLSPSSADSVRREQGVAVSLNGQWSRKLNRGQSERRGRTHCKKNAHLNNSFSLKDIFKPVIKLILLL